MFPCERIFADFLDSKGLDWEYESKRFRLGSTTYQPDFYVSSEDIFYEVVGTKQAFHSIRPKVELMAQFYPSVILKTVNPDGSPYRNRTWDGGEPLIIEARSITLFMPRTMIDQINRMAEETPEATRSLMIRSLLRERIQQVIGEKGKDEKLGADVCLIAELLEALEEMVESAVFAGLPGEQRKKMIEKAKRIIAQGKRRFDERRAGSSG